MSVQTLYVWGDSIARNVIFDETRNRYRFGADTYDRALTQAGVHVINRAKMGATSVAGLAAAQKDEPIPGAAVAIVFGGNDSDLNWKCVAESPETVHAAAVSLDDYKTALKAMVRLAREGQMKPIIVTPPPLVAERYMEWVSRGLNRDAIVKYLGSAFYIYRWHERYAYAAYDAAQECRCPVYNLRQTFLEIPQFEDCMCIDGIHPNDKGQAYIRTSVMQAWEQAMD